MLARRAMLAHPLTVCGAGGEGAPIDAAPAVLAVAAYLAALTALNLL